MTAFGPPIPHNWGSPFPYLPNTEVRAYFDGHYGASLPARMYGWETDVGNIPITAYRLPADHHAYGPRVSRMGRQPDRWVNAYPDGKNGMDHDDREVAILMGCPKSPGAPIGIWRIYLKEKAA